MMQESDKTLPSSGGWLDAFPPRRRHLLLAVLCIVVIYLGGVTGKWWPMPDGALYLGLAKSLAEGQGYQFNGEISSDVTPGFPLILASLRLLFGEGYWAPNFFVAFCGLGILWLAYRLLSRMSNPRMAFATVLCCAFSYTFYSDCHRILTDAPFALLFWATLCVATLAGRGSMWWLIPAAILTITALAIRAPGVLVFGSMVIGLLLDQHGKSRRRKMLLLAGGLLVAVITTVGFFYILGRGISDTSPLYARSVRWITEAPLWYISQRLGQATLAVPRLMAEMFTGQEGFLAFGLPATIWMITGGIIVLKRGRRMPLVTIILYMAALGIVAADDAIRPRYMLPVQPLIAYLVIEGLLWNVWAIGRWKNREFNPSLYLKVTTIFTALVLVVNAPRLARNAVYYSYLSHTPRYYQVVRDGKFAELFEVAEIIRRDHSDDKTVTTNSDELSILHFLSERVITPFPKTANRQPVQTEKIHRFVISHSDSKFIVLDIGSSGESESFRRRLKELFENTPGLELRHDGERYRVYEKTELLGRCPVIYRVNRETL